MNRILPTRLSSTTQPALAVGASGNRTDPGTLLWIGGRDSRYFQQAYGYSESQVAQIAYRSNIAEALSRPATGVKTIACCRDNDSIAEHSDYLDLRQIHSHAEAFLLLGPLCAGQRPHPSEQFSTAAFYWHEWENYLPSQLVRCGLMPVDTLGPTSIAVISSRYDNASSLLAIASVDDTPAIWCSGDRVASLQNIDQYWWDDTATRQGDWPSRLAKCQNPDAEHVWITGLLTHQEKTRAVDAGVGLVVAKPGDLTVLIDRASSQRSGSAIHFGTQKAA